MLATMRQMALNYSKLKPNNYIGFINITIDNNDFIISLKEDSVTVEEGLSNDHLFTIEMSNDTYQKLLNGTWNGLTAGGKAKMRDKAPVEFMFPPNKKVAADTLQLVYHLGTHFFSNSYPSKTKFGPNHSRNIHGGNAVALAYGHGMRSAYYCISGNEQINSNEKDPWWQCFTIIGGKGEALIDGEKVMLEKGVAVHIPPFVTHTFRASDGELLELIWLAYGNKA